MQNESCGILAPISAFAPVSLEPIKCAVSGCYPLRGVRVRFEGLFRGSFWNKTSHVSKKKKKRRTRSRTTLKNRKLCRAANADIIAGMFYDDKMIPVQIPLSSHQNVMYFHLTLKEHDF